MIRISSAKQVSDIMEVIRKLGGEIHLGESRGVVVMTTEDFARCIEAAREGAMQGVVDFFNDKPRAN